MDLALTDEQTMLRDTIGRVLTDRSDPAQAGAGPIGGDDWRALAELGALAFLLPETGGGMSGRADDVMVIAEALGRGLAITPVGEAVVGAGGILARSGSAEQVDRWVAPMISGEHLLALASGTVREEHGRLSGSLAFVRWAPEAAAIVVPDGGSAFICAAGSPGLTMAPVRLADGTPAALLSLDGCPAERIEVSPNAVAGTLALVHLTHAAEQVGLMAALLAQTNEYVALRQQFGMPIGTFQAVQHKIARMFVALEQARSITIKAAATGTESPDFGRAAFSAKAYVAEAAQRLAEDAVQLHGGIGVTDELAVGRALRRVMVLGRLFGGSAEARRKLAA